MAGNSPSVRQPATRGRILDRHGAVLADNRPSYCVAFYIEELRQSGPWSNTVNRVDALLDEAYLAHRLVEEVNDRYITHLGQPLIPLDTTVANVIAHQLIGEPFANQLDEAVHHAVDELLDEQVFQQDSVQEYRTRRSNPQTVAAWQNWPCLSRQLGVELGLPVSA